MWGFIFLFSVNIDPLHDPPTLSAMGDGWACSAMVDLQNGHTARYCERTEARVDMYKPRPKPGKAPVGL